MIQELSSKLLKQLEQELEEIACQSKDPLVKLTLALKPIRQSLQKLKNYLNDHPFTSKEEEIRFFKYIKPDFYCWQIYYTELYTVETEMPRDNAEKQIAYFEQELHYVERFFHQYQFHYQYYRLNASELDSLYFLRGVQVESVLLPNGPDVDPNFSTSSDYLFSKIKAFEHLKDWIQERLMFLRSNPLVPYQQRTDSGEMIWTGDTINLAEVGIAIFNTGQLNNGTATLSQIFRWLEEKFHVSIGIPSKRYAEIRRRKRLSRTQYLDEMKDSIIRKLDKEDEYEPDKVKRN
ncbi:MAG: RteC domain-containing protein [Daejeonella sp.]